jgi:hypothetical protein
MMFVCEGAQCSSGPAHHCLANAQPVAALLQQPTHRLHYHHLLLLLLMVLYRCCPACRMRPGAWAV